VEGVQHVFTDGTATAATLPTKLAAWGCLNATSGEVVAMGHDPGLSQLSDRAELLAALSAIDGQVHFGVSMHMWTDSKYVADGISHILQSGVIGDRSNQDIWERVHQLLHQLGQLEHVPTLGPQSFGRDKVTGSI
jgi:ribonuclease HI